MVCPFCSSEATKVLNSRPESTERARKGRCTQCGQAFPPSSGPTADGPMVKKRDGRLEPLSRVKLTKGMKRYHSINDSSTDELVLGASGRLRFRG